MKTCDRALSLAFALALALVPAGRTPAQTADTIRAGRFDHGKMWTFEYPPARYFSETYGFEASAAWFERARLAALRIPGCSASFVSPHGLVVTNHHCVRGAVSQVSRPGESLLDNGFYATSLEEERPVANFYADQLIAALDVSDEVLRAVDPG
ncbi:MAG: S46 family peptidase, partial [Gemmatimonadetes bacterium]|nr:S46 family peptidase [Gemmatimonadota bacterium]